MKLWVREASKEDVYRDFVRVPAKYRVDRKGREVLEGSVCKVSVGNREIYALARGCGTSGEPVILIDERLRQRLNIEEGSEIEVEFESGDYWGMFSWALHASDPAYRVMAGLSTLSLLLGILGLILGFISFSLAG